MSTTTDDPLHISITEEGRLCANAVVSSDSAPGWMQASLHLEPGQRPATSGQLVDAVLELTEAQPGTLVQLSFPLGEVDILKRMRQRCRKVEVRAAGASCLVSGVLAST